MEDLNVDSIWMKTVRGKVASNCKRGGECISATRNTEGEGRESNQRNDGTEQSVRKRWIATEGKN